jgi:hypothetical protein
MEITWFIREVDTSCLVMHWVGPGWEESTLHKADRLPDPADSHDARRIPQITPLQCQKVSPK